MSDLKMEKSSIANIIDDRGNSKQLQSALWLMIHFLGLKLLLRAHQKAQGLEIKQIIWIQCSHLNKVIYRDRKSVV